MKINSDLLINQCNGRIKVMAVTGIRSEYDLMFPLLDELERSDSFELSVVVTGSHLTPLHNYSVSEIEKDGFSIVARIQTDIARDDTGHRVKACAQLMMSLADIIAAKQPDLLLVLGDREEPLVTAMVGNYMAVPVVHLAGGDSTNPEGGNVDEQARHATTKLSHLHLAMTPIHKSRILQLGEEEWRVHSVGSGGVDRLRLTPVLSISELAAQTGLKVQAPYAVLIHHPLNGQNLLAIEEINSAVIAAKELGLHLIIGAPNSDPGSTAIFQHIQNLNDCELYYNLPRDEFINLLRYAEVLLGNSSLAFHEADYLGLPALNIGARQTGRLHSGHVVFTESTAESVKDALYYVLHDRSFRCQLKKGISFYGDGYMAEKALQILLQLPIKSKLIAKHLTY
ncbi:MAG: UDP-N-acetylglucosamine 2-epimerase (hydrolyzing) [Gammaproteobacteria bacterium]|nr:UDP-N-acetylglucosamine 2-epimerase (hydrolyzing) [Gammaproteobacteria bacterium]MBU2058381.1 UDP-N-acetylglucosamine 2-epimerase (hydrolyzing) [Gammaproteobacteria bacterium]MBU2176566.1 UDP-N-acetylglucosamine 2-epimerase (hydrolyzing) [Gammaproteobacteria bacterium]MBU2248492.1 UDP-N-acetylglucosamine 2-epimerase (hydrolyzing) [Gammaproteobacteria bacterium]MBU2345645.1 UDP-N-acetylglucosamine 2-epimerase (hydrolyzing) [Gammaproteobacteria bacterium]